MKKANLYIALAASLMAAPALAQTTVAPHYTMFMYNKLLYNPAYAGSRDVLSVNALYRAQWVGIDGAPRNMAVSIDAPVGSYMKPFRHVALGLSVSNESAGVLNNTNFMAYYAYRIALGKTMLSLGLQAGASMMSAKYGDLNPMQQGDASLSNNFKNEFLPNFGAGVYWRGDRFYAGVSVPHMLENYYDKDNKVNNVQNNRQVRGYYASAGYVFQVSESVKLEPQGLFRYAGNGKYQLPATADLNLSVIFYDRLMFGATWRTDNSVAGIVHLQVAQRVNVGYSYDYATKVLNGFTGGSHEFTVGFDFTRDQNKYVHPRFVSMF
ncbi:MAG: type IX secretion system membrane protein PorP/SprF [Chitinophagaceae bacterium]